jgi:hypothetical protein
MALRTISSQLPASRHRRRPERGRTSDVSIAVVTALVAAALIVLALLPSGRRLPNATAKMPPTPEPVRVERRAMFAVTDDVAPPVDARPLASAGGRPGVGSGFRHRSGATPKGAGPRDEHGTRSDASSRLLQRLLERGSSHRRGALVPGWGSHRCTRCVESRP